MKKEHRDMLYDLLKSRRSIRKYQSREIEKEKLDQILKCALLSPSSRSRRPWEFIAVTDRELLSKLSQCREHSSQFLAGAPLGIPQKYTVESIVAIGYPAEDKKPYNENELPFEKIHFNRY
jgi:nitroreductase